MKFEITLNSSGTFGMFGAFLAQGEVIYADKYTYGPTPLSESKTIPYAFPNWIGLNENHSEWRKELR